MISLGTTQKIQVITAGDGGEQVDVLAAWVDTSDDLPASAETNITSATTTDVVASPSSGLRQVDLINIRNKDTASCDVTVQQVNSSGSKTVQLIKVALPAGFTLQFSRSGWQIIDTALDSGASFGAQCNAGTSLSAGTWTKIPYTETFDSHGWYDGTTNYRFTPLLKGVYRFSAGLYVQSPADQKYIAIALRKNNVNSTSATDTIVSSMRTSGTGDGAAYVAGAFYLNGETDYVEAHGISEDTKSLISYGAYNYFFGEWVGYY